MTSRQKKYNLKYIHSSGVRVEADVSRADWESMPPR